MMPLKRAEKKKLLGRHNKVAKWLVKYFSKIRKKPSEVFFSEYCVIFRNTYFEVHLRTTASSTNIFIKLRKSKNYLYGALTCH